MFFISLAYIINFTVNDKYTYDIKTIDNTTNNKEGYREEDSYYYKLYLD